VTSTTQPARARPEVPWAPLLMAVGATLIGAGGLLLAGHITIWSVLAAMVVVLIGKSNTATTDPAYLLSGYAHYQSEVRNVSSHYGPSSYEGIAASGHATNNRGVRA